LVYKRNVRALVLCVCLLLAAATARAEDFQLPGLDADAQSWLAALQKAYPAGADATQRDTAAQQAAQAAARGDTEAAAAALERRAGMGETSADLFQSLARAELNRAAPDDRHALFAAWLAFGAADDDAQIPPLLLMADALQALGRNVQAAQVLQQVVQRAPDDAGYRQRLAQAQRAAGVAVSGITVEGEADPPRACLHFVVPLTRRPDFVPQDWVRLDPPVAGAAVTREGDLLCISGLPSGAVTRATLLAGLPSEPVGGGPPLALAKDTTVRLAVPDRQPRAVFDTRLFVLPRGQATSVSLATINLSAVKLKLMRLTERGVQPFLQNNRLGQPVDRYAADAIGDQSGQMVWQGTAAIPNWQRNRTQHTALPLPDALTTAGPGLYALLAMAGDGTPVAEGAASVQMIFRTDLAPTLWRGADGLTVQVRGYADAGVRPGVKLRLLAQNNDVLGEATTDAQGVARFAAPLLHGDGPMAPAVVDAEADGDYCALDLNAASFDLSDRGVSGAPDPGPLDAFVWFDRGIYRPGETVQVMALLRDNAGAPVALPARFTLRRPDGQVFLRADPARLGDAAFHWPVTLSRGAAVGTWTIEVQADPAGPVVGRGSFRVDAFVPDRMAVDLGPAPGPLVAGQALDLPVAARFLYGAPAAGLTGTGRAVLTLDPAPFPALVGYDVGLADELYAPARQQADLPVTDAQGRTSYALTIDHAPDTTHALKADVTVDVNDPSGHASRAALSVKLRPAAPLIGIREDFADGAVDAGTEAGFDIAAVDPGGARIALAAQLRLVRERPDWRMVMRGRFATYETVYRDEPVQTRTVAIPADGVGLHVARSLPFGRYRLEVTQADGLAASSVRFWSGWADQDSPDVPDRVDVSADRRAVPVGGSVRVHIAPPFAGRATLLVLSDRVLGLRTLDVPAGGTDVDVPVDASWGPGAYVAAHVFAGGVHPRRAIGLVWVGVDPAARTWPMTIDAADALPPRAADVVRVRAAPGAFVTLAAVDEGILRLTEFASPDPAAHYLGRRALGLDIRDDWGRLIPPAEGLATMLHQGGDEGSFVLPNVPQHTVTLFAGPVQAGADGVALFTLPMPDFNGQVRLMAVGWLGDRIGAASRDAIVRDRLVAEALLPRFLAPGDTTRLAVLLHNVELPAGAVHVALSTTGPWHVEGPAALDTTLAAGAQSLATATLHADGAGQGGLRMEVTGPEHFAVRHDTSIVIRPARGALTAVAGGSLPAGDSLTLAPPLPLSGFVPGTASAVATFGAPVRYDVPAVLAQLAAYPLGCLEQAVSKGLPLALAPPPDGGIALAGQVQAVLDRQRYDGAFGLWSAEGDAEPWLSAYATEFLLRARAAVSVPGPALDQALVYLAQTAQAEADDTPEFRAAQAYRLYVLALAGQGLPGAARVLAERLDALPTPLARAQVAAALALAHDPDAAGRAFGAALAAPGRGYWSFDYGTALRDQAAVAVLLRESGLLPDRLAALMADLPGADLDPRVLSTQELAWTAAAAEVLGRGAAPPRLSVGGRVQAGVLSIALAGPETVRNLGHDAVWHSVSVRGVPLAPAPASRAQMRVTRQFFAADGGTLDLDHLTQNTEFVELLEGTAQDGQDHRAMLLQGLPAGWEIAGRLASGTQDSMPWLGTLSETEAQPGADDRYAAVLDLTADKPAFRVAVRLRAVTPGDYEFPGAELSDMYRPTVFARQTANRIAVLPP
jgi:uncharacterized protein YfaS (alpha-2-macroglobulin family)